MSSAHHRLLAFGLGAALWLLGPRARAEDLPAWPVRFNVSLPLGKTYGRESMHGFTWGFRGSLLAYPTASGRGLGVGLYAEALDDAQSHSSSAVGAVCTAPLWSWEWLDWRLGGAVGSRSFEQDDERRISTALITEWVLPAYVYDFRLGLRADATTDSNGVSATSLLVEVDVAVLLAGIGVAAGAR